MAYDANISIGGLVLLINPEKYTKEAMKMGSFARTTSGNLVGQDVSGKKYVFRINGLTQSQIEEIKKRAALEYNVALIDYVPVAERESQSRSVYQLISSETINGETVYLYIPSYTVAITDFTDSYEGNIVSYGIVAEEQ
jgi:hypothetical protein